MAGIGRRHGDEGCCEGCSCCIDANTRVVQLQVQEAVLGKAAQAGSQSCEDAVLQANVGSSTVTADTAQAHKEAKAQEQARAGAQKGWPWDAQRQLLRPHARAEERFTAPKTQGILLHASFLRVFTT